MICGSIEYCAKGVTGCQEKSYRLPGWQERTILRQHVVQKLNAQASDIPNILVLSTCLKYRLKTAKKTFNPASFSVIPAITHTNIYLLHPKRNHDRDIFPATKSMCLSLHIQKGKNVGLLLAHLLFFFF